MFIGLLSRLIPVAIIGAVKFYDTFVQITSKHPHHFVLPECRSYAAAAAN